MVPGTLPTRVWARAQRTLRSAPRPAEHADASEDASEEGAMELWMLVLGAAIVLLPVVLMLAFHGGDRADARGRRVRRTWRTRTPTP